MAVLITATGPTALRSFEFPDADAKILTDAALVELGEGGTGADLSATGGAGKVLKQLTAGAAVTVGLVTDAELSTSDVTTNNVSTSKHGFAPKGDGDTTKFLNANGAYSSPAGGVAPTYTAKTGTYSAAANDLVVCTANSFTVTLPAASSNLNKMIWVVNNGTGTITIGHSGSDTVGLASTQTLNPATASAQGDAMCFISDGISNWVIV